MDSNMNSRVSSCPSSIGIEKAVRMKYWGEMNDSERIVKLQDELRRTQKQVADLSKHIGNLLQHDHSNGHMIVRMPSPYDGESIGGILNFRIEDYREAKENTSALY